MGSVAPGANDVLGEAFNQAGIWGANAGPEEWWERGDIPYPDLPTAPFGFHEDHVREGMEISPAAPGIEHIGESTGCWQAL